MGLQRWMACDGPICNVNVPFPEQNGILTNRTPKDWLAINIISWRQVHPEAGQPLKTTIPTNDRYFCSPRCLTLFSLVWWLGPKATNKDQITLDIRRLSTDDPVIQPGQTP